MEFMTHMHFLQSQATYKFQKNKEIEEGRQELERAQQINFFEHTVVKFLFHLKHNLKVCISTPPITPGFIEMRVE